MEFNKIIFNSSDHFVENGNVVKGDLEKIYVGCYNSLISKILNNESPLMGLSVFSSSIIDDISAYSKFHIASLLIDINHDLDEIFKFLSLDFELCNAALKSYDTSNMWFTSNIHMGALSIISKSNNEIGLGLAKLTIQNLDKINFTSTKWKYKGSINRIAAFYHYVPFLDRYNIPISQKTLNILMNDLVTMQNSLGSFSSPNGFSCIELDSVVVLAFLKKRGFNVDYLLESKLFNAQSTLNENGWSLYGRGQNKISSFFDLLKNVSSIQDLLWNTKKIFLDVHKLQYDNGHKELGSNSFDATLMSNYFGLITYMQLISALNLEVNNDIKQINSYSLAYVI